MAIADDRESVDHKGRPLHWSIVCLVAALLLGGFVRLWNVSGQSLFLDEAFVFDAASRPVHALLAQIAYHDAHPPLFYLVTHWLLQWLHWPKASFRYVTAPFGLLTIAATWGIARRVFGDLAAAVAALTIALEPAVIQLDRLYRTYGMLAGLGAASWWLILAAGDAKGKMRAVYWVLYACAIVTVTSTHYLGWMLLATQLAYAVFAQTRRGVPAWPAMAAAAACAAAMAPWFWALPIQFHQGGYAGAAGASAGAWSLARGVLGYALPVEWYGNPVFDIAFSLFAAAALAGGLWFGRGSILPWYAAPLAVQAVAAAAFGKDLLLARYLLYLVPAFAIAFGGVTAALLQSRAWAGGAVAAVAMLACNGAAATNETIDPVYQLPDWHQVAAWVSQYGARGDAIVLDQGYPYLILRDEPIFAGRDISAPTLASQITSTIRWIDARPTRRIWYVENQSYYPDPSRLVLAHLEATRALVREELEVRADLSNRVVVALFAPARGAAR